MRHRHLPAMLATVAGIALAGALAAPAQASQAAAGSTAKALSAKAPGGAEGGSRGGRGPGGAYRPVEEDGTFRVGGSVAAVDAAASAITVSHPGKAGDTTESITVGSDATVTLDGAAATLAGIPAGARVTINGTEVDDVRTATEVVVVTSWDLRLDGFISAVDATTGSITVTRPAPRSGDTTTTGVTVTVGADATVTLDGKAATLADLAVGANVRVMGTEGTTGRSVTKVEARSPKKATATPKATAKKSGKR